MKRKMFTKMITLLITLCMIVSMVSVGIVNVSANTSSDGEWMYGYNPYLFSWGGAYVLSKYVGTKTTATLPTEIDGNKITAISVHGDDLGTLKHITIPKTYEYMDFSESNVASVTCSREYTEPIMYLEQFGTFYKCKKLKKVVLPNMVANSCITPELFYDEATNTYLDNRGLESNTFKNCTNLEEVVLPDNIAEIGYECFKNCKSLTSLTIPNGVQYIYGGFTDFCDNLTTLTLPGTIVEIPPIYTADNCTFIVPKDSYVDNYIKEQEAEYKEVGLDTNYTFINSEPVKEAVTGDANGDGTLNIMDATVMQKVLAGLYTFKLNNCDITEDGKFNICDVTHLQRKIAKID